MLLQSIYISFQIVAIYVAFSEGAPLGEIRIWLLNKTKYNLHWIYKPVFDCLTCMGWLWGGILSYLELGQINIFQLVSLIGINYIISGIINKLND